jgi:hypothetical protein
MTTALRVLVISWAWRSGGDRSPRISRITAGHGLRVLLDASVHKGLFVMKRGEVPLTAP